MKVLPKESCYIYSAKKRYIPPSSEVKCYFFYFSLEGVKQDPIIPTRYKIKRYERSVGQRRRSSGRISRWRCGEFLVQFSPSANRETSGFRRKCVFSFILKVIIDFHYYFSKFHVLRHLW